MPPRVLASGPKPCGGKNQKSKIKNVKRNFQLSNWIKIKIKWRCSVFVSFVQNENKETYTVSFILILELSILKLKQNQKSPRFSQLLWMSKDIIFFFLSLVLKTWIYRTQYRDQNINNRNRILITMCDENQISKKIQKTPSREGECKFARGRRGYRTKMAATGSRSRTLKGVQKVGWLAGAY